MRPQPAHAGEVVLELGELDLELAVGRVGMVGEDVEDHGRAVDDRHAELLLEVALLARAELVVAGDDVGVRRRHQRLELVDLARARDRGSDADARAAGSARRPPPRRRCAGARAARTDPLRGTPRRRPRAASPVPRARRSPGSIGRCGRDDPSPLPLSVGPYPAARGGTRRAARRADARSDRHPVRVALRDRALRAHRRSSCASPACACASWATRACWPARTRRRSCSPATSTRCPRRTTCPAGSRATACTGWARAT